MSGRDVEAALEELKINVSESGKEEEMNPVDLDGAVADGVQGVLRPSLKSGDPFEKMGCSIDPKDRHGPEIIGHWRRLYSSTGTDNCENLFDLR